MRFLEALQSIFIRLIGQSKNAILDRQNYYWFWFWSMGTNDLNEAKYNVLFKYWSLKR